VGIQRLFAHYCCIFGGFNTVFIKTNSGSAKCTDGSESEVRSMAKVKTFAVYVVNEHKVLDTIKADTIRQGAVLTLRKLFGVVLLDVTDSKKYASKNKQLEFDFDAEAGNEKS